MHAPKLFIGLFCVLLSIAAQAGIVLNDLTGQEINTASLKGKWVFINYWASWCQPCVDEIAELNEFYEQNRDKNVAVFAVNFDGLPLAKQQRLVRKFNIRYPSLRQNPAALFHLGAISVVPVTFVIDPQGRLNETLYGGQTLASLKDVLTHSMTS